MSQITLETAVEVTPAIAAVTTNNVIVLSVTENYGSTDPEQPGPQGTGRRGTVEVDVLLGDQQSGQTRRLVAWEGDAYLAVRGTWTDADLNARIIQILTGQ